MAAWVRRRENREWFGRKWKVGEGG